MGMSIDEAIIYLRALKKCETCEEGDIGRCKLCSCYRIGNSAKCYDAIDVGIDTMCKYKKIQEAMDNRADDFAESNSKALNKIEVIMYGNVD